MHVLTSKDIEESLGIPNRTQIYLVDHGYIEADIRSEKPRIFSQRQAFYMELICYLKDFGFDYSRAGRVGRMVGAAIFDATAKIPAIKHDLCTVCICNGVALIDFRPLAFESEQVIVSALSYYFDPANTHSAASFEEKTRSLRYLTVDEYAKETNRGLLWKVLNDQYAPTSADIKNDLGDSRIEIVWKTERAAWIGFKDDPYLIDE